MAVSDQEIISRFPVGYYELHPNVSLNFQMNRFYGWNGGDDQILTLTGAPSVTARVFTETEQAQSHCQVGNQGLAIKLILDWLDQAGGRTAA